MTYYVVESIYKPKNENVPLTFENFQFAKDCAEAYKDRYHLRILKIEEVYVTSTLDEILKDDEK